MLATHSRVTPSNVGLVSGCAQHRITNEDDDDDDDDARGTVFFDESLLEEYEDAEDNGSVVLGLTKGEQPRRTRHATRSRRQTAYAWSSGRAKLRSRGVASSLDSHGAVMSTRVGRWAGTTSQAALPHIWTEPEVRLASWAWLAGFDRCRTVVADCDPRHDGL